MFYTRTFDIQLWVLIFYHIFHVHTIQHATSYHYNIVYTPDQSIGEPHASENHGKPTCSFVQYGLYHPQNMLKLFIVTMHKNSLHVCRMQRTVSGMDGKTI